MNNKQAYIQQLNRQYGVTSYSYRSDSIYSDGSLSTGVFRFNHDITTEEKLRFLTHFHNPHLEGQRKGSVLLIWDSRFYSGYKISGNKVSFTKI